MYRAIQLNNSVIRHLEKSRCFYYALEKNVKERTPEKGGKTSESKKG